MEIQYRPFHQFASNTLIILVSLILISFPFTPPFVSGILLSIAWTLLAYTKGVDLPNQIKQDRAGKAALGFFLIVFGIVLAGIGPIYLDTQSTGTDWLVMLGIFLGAQVGLSLLLATPLRSLSFWCGFTAAAIILHSAIFRFPSDFGNLVSAKAMVLASITLSSWFLGIWLFFDNPSLDSFEESKKAKQAKSIIGIFSGLLTVIEFINIMYTIINFR